MNVNKYRPQKHLVNILCSTKAHHPNFSLFLGAGASISSGVPSASVMIQQWRNTYEEMYREAEKALNQQSWYGKPEEYSVLFELLYDQASQRREYIETQLEKARPSWGYIYLVNLLRKTTFNTIFTTNFDDLLNEACYQFSSDTRPIVCAHDSSISSVRISSKRPKIIKLHGDFLFDNIKNTVTELETLEDNMRAKFRQYAAEFGMIVVGYSGNDRSIMQPLHTLLRSDANFPHGIYWCIKKNAQISEEVRTLTRFPRFNIVEIKGFDEFFAEIHEALECKLQPEMVDPYSALASKLNKLLDDANVPADDKHPIIHRDISALARKVTEITLPYDSLGKVETKNDNFDKIEIDFAANKALIPYKLLAQVARNTGEKEQSISLLKRQLETKPTEDTFRFAFQLIEDQNVDNEFVTYVVNVLCINPMVIDCDPATADEYAVKLMNSNHFEQAERILDFAYDRNIKGLCSSPRDLRLHNINKCLVKRLRHEEISESNKRELLSIVNENPDTLFEIGSLILLGEYNEAKQKLLNKNTSDIEAVLNWPISKPLPEEHRNEIEEFLANKIKNLPKSAEIEDGPFLKIPLNLSQKLAQLSKRSKEPNGITPDQTT